MFLTVIAKALTVQLKTKGSESTKPVTAQAKSGATSVTLTSVVPTPAANSPRWWLRGSATKKQADLIISLIRDMTMVSIDQCPSSMFSLLLIEYNTYGINGYISVEKINPRNGPIKIILRFYQNCQTTRTLF